LTTTADATPSSPPKYIGVPEQTQIRVRQRVLEAGQVGAHPH
jgi:hypothetical protein